MENKFNIVIAGPYDGENLVAEIWFNDQTMICELNTENQNLEITFYNEKESVYNYDDFIEALVKAKKELLGE